MVKTLRFGSRTPITIDRHVTRRRTNQSYDQLMAMDDAARHISQDIRATPFGKRSVAPPKNTSFADALRTRRMRFLANED